MTLEILTKATLILLTVGLGSMLLRRRSAATRHLSQLLGLAAILLLPLAIATVPALELPVLAPEAMQAVVADAAADADQRDCWPKGCDDSAAFLPSLDASAVAEQPIGERPTFGALADLPWLGILWLAGVALVLSRLAHGWISVRRLARRSRPLESERVLRLVDRSRDLLGLQTRTEVRVGPAVRVPMLWGFLKPTLLLPEAALTWPTDRLRVALLHELAHQRRRDGLSLLICRLTAAAWWFHPLVWFVERRTRRDCEQACDDLVVACGERPSNYANQLLAIAGALSPRTANPAASLALVSPGQLEKRLMSILHPGKSRGLSRRAVAALVALFAVGLLTLSSTQFVARAGEPQEPHEHQDKMKRHAHGDDSASPGQQAYKRAYKLHEAERFAEAAAAFELAADSGYRVATSQYNAACGYARLGRTSDAIAFLERALESGFESKMVFEDSDFDPIRSQPAFRRLLTEVRGDTERDVAMDKYDEARKAYRRMLDNDNTDGDAWYKVGSALLGVREYTDAVDALERASRTMTREHNALYNLTCAYALQGRDDEALDYLRQAVLAGFESDERLDNDSDLAGIRDSAEFAEIRSLHDRLSLQPFRKVAHKERHDDDGSEFDSEYSVTAWAPAVDHFRQFVSEQPSAGRGWYNLGWSLHFSHQHVEARDAFMKQAELGYRSENATYNIACTFAMEGDTRKALDWLERAADSETVSASQLVHDEDLQSLREEPRFLALVDRLHEERPNEWKVKAHKKYKKRVPSGTH